MELSLSGQKQLQAFEAEYLRARQKFPPFNSGHEGYAVLLEELDELWDAVKSKDMTQARKEAVQVGAMALAFILDLAEYEEP